MLLKLTNTPYYWFYVNNKRNMLYILFTDYVFILKNTFNDVINMFVVPFNALFSSCEVITSDFFYFHGTGSDTSYTQYRKLYIRDMFVKSINS